MSESPSGLSGKTQFFPCWQMRDAMQPIAAMHGSWQKFLSLSLDGPMVRGHALGTGIGREIWGDNKTELSEERER